MSVHRRSALVAVAGLTLTLAGCGGRLADGGTTDDREPTATWRRSGPAAEFAYTHLGASGNRTVGGAGDLSPDRFVDVPVSGTPVWVVGRPADGVEWLVVTRSGAVEAFAVDGGDARPVDVPTDRLPTGTPPMLAHEGPPTPTPLGRPTGSSTTTHPFPVGPDLAVDVAESGAVRWHGPEGTADAGVAALPDARFVRTADGVAVLTGPTDSYGHAVLGDGTEATGVAVLSPGERAVVRSHEASDGRVIEGIAPLVGEFEGLGECLVVTESGPEDGAQVVAHTGDGQRVPGPPIGTGFRWRHQLALAPFAPDGTPELAVVRTPHIGGTVEFYRPVDGRLEVAASRAGYSSHVIGSRNLDGAVAGDVDGDGRAELVVPDDPRRELGVLSRTADGVTESFRLPVGGRITSNLHAVETDGGIQLAVCRQGTLRVFA